MKYLMLFLSFNVFADFKVDILNHEGQTMSTEFKTELEADDYIEATKHRWGKDQRWTKVDCGNSTDTRLDTYDQTEYDCPQNYTVTKTDITASKLFENIEKVALAKLACAVKVKAHVGALNLFNGKTSTEIQAIMTTYVDVIKLLDAGALDTALALITSLPTTVEIDQAYKDSVIAKINSCNVSI